MKWLLNEIDENDRVGINFTESVWVDIHNDGYDIWSISADQKLQAKIFRELSQICHKKILILGCGSKVNLQNYLCKQFTDISEIVCTDFEQAIHLSRQQHNDGRIKYICMDSRQLSYIDYFDVIICVNSVLSHIDADNRQMIKSCCDALKHNGTFIGLFPTVMCIMEIESIERRYNRIKRLFLQDKPRRDIVETLEMSNQIFYSPLFLRRIMVEADYEVDKVEIIFFDSADARQQAEKYYMLTDDDILVYELLVVAHKNLLNTTIT